MITDRSYLALPSGNAREDARVARTRAALRAALLELLDVHAFADITAVMIAERAGIGYATFFRRYPDTRALLLEIADAMIAQALAVLGPPILVGDHPAAMRSLVGYVAANRTAAHALLIGAGPEIQVAVTALAVDRAAAVPRSHRSTAVPADLAVRVMVAGGIATLAWWLAEAPDAPADQIAALLMRLVVAPVLDPPDR